MTTATTTRFDVPDVSCDHCVATITDRLGRIPGTSDVRVDVRTRTVEVTGTATTDAVRAALADAGYPAAS